MRRRRVCRRSMSCLPFFATAAHTLTGAPPIFASNFTDFGAEGRKSIMQSPMLMSLGMKVSSFAAGCRPYIISRKPRPTREGSKIGGIFRFAERRNSDRCTRCRSRQPQGESHARQRETPRGLRGVALVQSKGGFAIRIQIITDCRKERKRLALQAAEPARTDNYTLLRDNEPNKKHAS